MFDDRIEVISPGALPNHLTVEKILAGNTNIRNPIIASFVARGILPYWGLGTGIRRAKSAWDRIEFVDDRSGVQFKVVISTSNHEVSTGRVSTNEPNREPNEPNREPNGLNRVNEELLNSSLLGNMLLLLRQNAPMTIADLAESSGVSVATVKRNIAELKNRGLLKRIGGTRGRWEVVV